MNKEIINTKEIINNIIDMLYIIYLRLYDLNMFLWINNNLYINIADTILNIKSIETNIYDINLFVKSNISILIKYEINNTLNMISNNHINDTIISIFLYFY